MGCKGKPKPPRTKRWILPLAMVLLISAPIFAQCLGGSCGIRNNRSVRALRYAPRYRVRYRANYAIPAAGCSGTAAMQYGSPTEFASPVRHLPYEYTTPSSYTVPPSYYSQPFRAWTPPQWSCPPGVDCP